MKIRIGQEEKEALLKKGFLGVEFSEKEGRDGLVKERNGGEILAIVTGEKDKMTRRKLVILARRVIRQALAHKYEKIVVDLGQFRFPTIEISDADLAELLAVNFQMAHFSFRKYLSQPKEGWPEVKEVVVLVPKNKDIEKGLAKGLIIGEEVNQARYIANMPGGEMTPAILAKHARDEMRGLPVRVKILDEREMKRLGMGGVLGVGMGSQSRPRFIILEYFGGSKKEKPIVLVGKGVTFDTGGINLKPSQYITDMNMDMSGGAAVIHALAAAARLKLKKNIIVLVPAVENMPSGESYRPGDVLRTMSGKTIEVQDTDAEGRIILADALEYAKRYKPQLVVDVATLTGSAIVALGERASAIFTKDENLELKLRHLGEESGDYVWPMPLWDEYDEDVKGTFGDVANVGKTKWGGAITAAAFLKQFVGNAYKWVHIDMAPRMTAHASEQLSKGAAGAPVRLLVRLLEKF